jgi:hypothetical protein
MAIILIAGAIVYLSALRTGFLGIDDVGLIQGLISSEFSVYRLLFSGAGEYFRPMPFISYAFDAYMAGTNPAWYHGINVALHLANGILVYYLCQIYLHDELEQSSYLPLTAGLFFVLHPLNSEAVMWISARPDLLCTLFSLLCLVQVVQIKDSPKLSSLTLLFVVYLFALGSKEIAIILMVIVPLFLVLDWCKRGEAKVFWVCLPLLGATILYLLLRGGKKVAVDKGINKLLSTVTSNSASSGSSTGYLDMVSGYGFYLKKLIYPFPLNFTIVNYNKTLAIATLVVTMVVGGFFFWRNRLTRLPLMLIFAGIALPVAAFIAKMPWTPFAERYLYLPMVGLSLLVAVLLLGLRKIPPIFPVLLVLLLAVPTIARVNLWSNPVAFWTDCVEKSPGHVRGYVALAAAQIDTRDYGAAEENLNKALLMGYTQEPLWRNMAQVHLARKEYGKYEAAMEQLALISLSSASVYREIIDNLMHADVPEAERPLVYERVIGYYLKAVEKEPSYNLAYYNIGKLYWAMGENRKAAHYLAIFIDKSGSDPLKPYARKIIDKIGTQNNLTNRAAYKK